MFYDTQLMNCNSLKNAWRAGTAQQLDSEEIPLPKVCKMLDSWIASDYQDPGRRLSLRASSILLDGAARLYRLGLDDLMEDMFKTEYLMITRNSRKRQSDEIIVPDLNTEEFERSNDNERSLGHSAFPVKCDSFDVNKGGKSKKNNMSNSKRIRSKEKKMKSFRTTTEHRRSNNSCNEDLPIGQIFIYDNPSSKVPSKLLVGKINSDVKKTIKF